MAKHLYRIQDDDGIPLKPGDYITFSFGIPPICVTARLSGDTGSMSVECIHPADVKPKTCSLAELMRWYQVWKASPQRVQAVLREFKIADAGRPVDQCGDGRA